MNIHEHIEEIVGAACERFNIPQSQRDEFADSVHEMVEFELEDGTGYNKNDFLRDLRGYLVIANSAQPMHISDYAAFTAGFIMALEFAEKTPELRERIAFALNRNGAS